VRVMRGIVSGIVLIKRLLSKQGMVEGALRLGFGCACRKKENAYRGTSHGKLRLLQELSYHSAIEVMALTFPPGQSKTDERSLTQVASRK